MCAIVMNTYYDTYTRAKDCSKHDAMFVNLHRNMCKSRSIPNLMTYDTS